MARRCGRCGTDATLALQIRQLRRPSFFVYSFPIFPLALTSEEQESKENTEEKKKKTPTPASFALDRPDSRRSCEIALLELKENQMKRNEKKNVDRTVPFQGSSD